MKRYLFSVSINPLSTKNEIARAIIGYNSEMFSKYEWEDEPKTVIVRKEKSASFFNLDALIQQALTTSVRRTVSEYELKHFNLIETQVKPMIFTPNKSDLSDSEWQNAEEEVNPSRPNSRASNKAQ